MSEAKEVDTKASSVIAAPDGGGATEKSTGGGAAKEGVIGATATGTKDTPPTKVCADGGVEVQKEVITAVASEDGTPAAKKQKVVCEVTPPDAKETKKAEDADTCKGCKLELDDDDKQQGGKCDRCKKSMCDGCTTVCMKCNDAICNKCRDCRDGSGGWDNEMEFCELCNEHMCGKCGSDEFVPLCAVEGMVCRECYDAIGGGCDIDEANYYL